MKRFLTIIDNKIISDRHYTEIVDGEVEDDGTYGEVGMILLDGVWQRDPQEIAEQSKQQRIAELKEIITNKNYLGDDVAEERAELRVLLGM
jgi:hypothetical protein